MKSSRSAPMSFRQAPRGSEERFYPDRGPAGGVSGRHDGRLGLWVALCHDERDRCGTSEISQ